jgi:hypothetical protein
LSFVAFDGHLVHFEYDGEVAWVVQLPFLYAVLRVDVLVCVALRGGKERVHEVEHVGLVQEPAACDAEEIWEGGRLREGVAP